MRTLRKAYLLLFVSMLLLGCTMNVKRVNQPEDKARAEEVINTFYANVMKNDYHATDSLFSEAFYATGGGPQLQKMFRSYSRQTGDIISFKLIDSKSNVVSGSNPSGFFLLTYNVTRTSSPTHETFQLALQKDGSIKIDGYNIKSPTNVQVQ